MIVTKHKRRQIIVTERHMKPVLLMGRLSTNCFTSHFVDLESPSTMNLRTAVIKLCFYKDAGAIHRNDNSRCAVRSDADGSFTVQVNWDRPSSLLPILEANYKTNDKDHMSFVQDMKRILRHVMHAHITSVQNLLTAFACGVEKADDSYPTAKHELRHGALLFVKKTVLDDHWQTTMTQYRGLSRKMKEEIGRILGMGDNCIVILNDDAETDLYDVLDAEEETIAAQLAYQLQLKIVDHIRTLGNGKLKIVTQLCHSV